MSNRAELAVRRCAQNFSPFSDHYWNYMRIAEELRRLDSLTDGQVIHELRKERERYDAAHPKRA